MVRCADDKKQMKPIAWKCPQCGEIYFGDECVTAICKLIDVAKKLEDALQSITKESDLLKGSTDTPRGAIL